MRNLVVITNYELGLKNGAAYSRIQCYRNALGVDYIVSCVILQHFCKRQKPYEFHDKDVDISFTQAICPDSYFYRNFIQYFDLIRPIRLLKYILSNFEKSTVFLLYCSNAPLFLTALLILRALGRKIVVEKNELETAILLNVAPPNGFSVLPFTIVYPVRIMGALLIDLFTMIASDIIVISRRLQILYNISKRTSFVPVLVDNDRFKYCADERQSSKKVKFLYSGMITLKKDALVTLLTAIAEMKVKLIGVAEFCFLGPMNSKTMSIFQDIVTRNELEEAVKWHPPVPSSKIPLLMADFDIGILLRENNLQTRYGFATKLAEYLSAGLVVMANDVSDNIRYLKNGVDSFIVNDLSDMTIQASIQKIIDNKDQLFEMRIKAREAAKINFDYKLYADILKEVFK